MKNAISVWSPQGHGAEESFIVLAPENGGDFSQQASALLAGYQDCLRDNDLGPAVTMTFFLSDAANQEPILRSHPAFMALDLPITLIQQPPAKSKIGLLAYHVSRPDGLGKRKALQPQGCKASASAVVLEAPAYEFIYFKNLVAAGQSNAASQTDALMGTSGQGLLSSGVVWPEVVRTWLYIHDIDTNYRPVSQARNALFERHGINAGTGFPASTGIEGRSADHNDVLLLDALAIKGLKPGQSRGMSVPTHMNPTVEYGVTFERGRAVSFGDRRHLYISGTASIDNHGTILFEGDVTRQTERAIENVRALLATCQAELSDMRYLLVYLRDSLDGEAVEAVLSCSGLKDVPRILVRAPVCRPGWLVEMEGVAIDGKGDKAFASF